MKPNHTQKTHSNLMHINKYSLFCKFCTLHLFSSSCKILLFRYLFLYTFIGTILATKTVTVSENEQTTKQKTKKYLTNNTLRLPTPNPTVKACKLHGSFNSCVPNDLLPNQRVKRERKTKPAVID